MGRLNTRVLLAFLAMLLLLTTVVLYYSSETTREQIEGEIERDMLLDAYVYQHAFNVLMALGNTGRIQELVALQGASTEVINAAFLDEDQQVIASISLRDIGRAAHELVESDEVLPLERHTGELRRNLRIQTWRSPNGRSLFLLAPVFLENLDGGGLEQELRYYLVEHDLSHVEGDVLRSLRENTLPLVALISGTLLVLYLFLQDQVTRRLVRLGAHARRYRLGDTGPGFPVTGNDEITELATTLNTLMERIGTHQGHLQYEKRRLEFIQKTARLGSFTYDPESRQLHLSEEALYLLGLSRRHAHLGLASLSRQVLAEDREHFERHFERAATSGDGLEFRYQVPGGDTVRHGYLKFSELLSTRVDDPGDAGALLGSIMDITSLKHAELSLRNQQFQNQRIIDNVQDAIVIFNQLGVVEQCNRATLVLFGMARYQVRTRPVYELIAFDEYAPGVDDFGRFLVDLFRDRSLIRHFSSVGTRGDGHTFSARVSLSMLPDDGAELRRYVLTCSDISALLEQQRHHAQNEKLIAMGQLSSGIAHDFNNILSVIHGFSELLHESLPPGVAAQGEIEEILRAVAQAQELTSKLLSYSRQTADRREPCDVDELLKGVAFMLQFARNRGVELVVRPIAAACTIRVHRHGFSDMLLNICMNAIHAMPEGGELAISAEARHLERDEAASFNLVPGHYALINVADNGHGMKPEVLERIFEPFFSTKGSRGTGLGLAQVYNYLKNNGGAVRVDSKEGVGTVFRLAFAVVEIAEPLQGQEPLPVTDDRPRVPPPR